MKKKLCLLAQATLVSSSVLVTTACRNPFSGSGEEGKPPEPPIKDIAYYQALIEQQEKDIVDCDQMIEEIKANRDGYDDEEEYQSALDEVVAEQYFLKAAINECQYQILLLEKQGDKFTPDQILLGITIFTARIINLDEELKLKEKYPDYYPEAELQVIKDAITDSKAILKIFEDLKEEE